MATGEIWEGRMGKDRLTAISQPICNHVKQRWYTERRFDILNGFELVTTRCDNCHKIITLDIKKIS